MRLLYSHSAQVFFARKHSVGLRTSEKGEQNAWHWTSQQPTAEPTSYVRTPGTREVMLSPCPSVERDKQMIMARVMKRNTDPEGVRNGILVM